MSGSLPTVITKAGLQPQSPDSLRDQLLTSVAATNPGYTANLPGSLIEDISSTDVAAIALCDQARVELVNSLTPYGANAFLMTQLGNIYGVQRGQGSTTSVYVVFTGSVGFVLARGFTVSDGTFQYELQDGGIIESSGQSAPLYALASLQGSWAVPANTVTQLVTSVPSSVTLSVNNPLAGTPGPAEQTEEEYRVQVLQAGLAVSQGMATALRTALDQVDGVQARLVSVRQQTGGGWEVLVGGGDPYAVANAIFTSLFDISTLVGSVIGVTEITQADPGVVTTDLNHGKSTGDVVQLNGVVGMTEVNGDSFTITVIDEKSFSLGVDTSGYSAYVSGGVVTPNSRNTVVTVQDYPDTYEVAFVIPPQQTVAITLLWGTTSPNIISAAAVAQVGVPALMAYVNSVYVGQPMNLFELQATFQEAVATLIPTPLLTRMVFSVSINGVGVSPEAGTGIIAGDPESYFETDASLITISQG